MSKRNRYVEQNGSRLSNKDNVMKRGLDIDSHAFRLQLRWRWRWRMVSGTSVRRAARGDATHCRCHHRASTIADIRNTLDFARFSISFKLKPHKTFINRVIKERFFGFRHSNNIKFSSDFNEVLIYFYNENIRAKVRKTGTA